MELILLVVLVVVLVGGSFGFYRSRYYRPGGPVGITAVLGLTLVALVIVWLVHTGGHSL
jgi:hypothetical protein